MWFCPGRGSHTPGIWLRAPASAAADMGAGGRASGWQQLTHVKQRASEELECAEEGPVGAVKILFKFVWPLSTETFKRGFLSR